MAAAALVAVAALPTFGSCSGDAVFHVSTTGAAGHHRSLRAARDAVREHRRLSQSGTSPVTVVVESGVYEIDRSGELPAKLFAFIALVALPVTFAVAIFNAPA